MRLCVIGCGYVGLVTGACFAEMGNDVIAVDNNTGRIEMLERGESPIYEPGLSELLVRNTSEGRLTFTSDIKSAVTSSNVVFICVGTPPAPDGSTDMTAVMAVARSIAENLNGYKVVVMKSTVPVGTCKRVAELIASLTTQEFDMASNPEFLKEGAALDDFFRPDRVVVGADSDRAMRVMRNLYSPFLRTGKPFIAMRTESSELTKHASNAMLASRISFINEVALLCQVTGADVEEVRRGMAADGRIGSQFLFPGLGFGGSCFPKDLRSLAHVGRESGSRMHLSEAATAVNIEARSRFLDLIADYFGGDLNGKRLAFWGLAFKPRTDDIREAPSVWIIQRALEKWPQVVIRAHDPIAMERSREVLGDRIQYERSVYGALEGADALVICTEWNEFRSPNFDRMKGLMAAPVIFDGRNLYEREMVREEGFTYFSVGRPPVRTT